MRSLVGVGSLGQALGPGPWSLGLFLRPQGELGRGTGEPGAERTGGAGEGALGILGSGGRGLRPRGWARAPGGAGDRDPAPSPGEGHGNGPAAPRTRAFWVKCLPGAELWSFSPERHQSGLVSGSVTAGGRQSGPSVCVGLHTSQRPRRRSLRPAGEDGRALFPLTDEELEAPKGRDGTSEFPAVSRRFRNFFETSH